MESITIPIKDLLIDPGLQRRVEGLNDEHVRELEEVVDDLPPIKVARRDGRYVPIDGHHTIAAHQGRGREVIAVVVMDIPEDQDLYHAAFLCNARHGMPLTLADRRAFAARLLSDDPTISNMEVARQAGLSPTTIAAVREQLETQQVIEPVDRRIGRSGQAYTVPTYSPSRLPGDLPQESLGQTLGRLFSSAERRQHRAITSYFQRLARALAEQDNLEGFETYEDAAKACQLVLGADKAAELGGELGSYAYDAYQVAVCLGYKPAEEEA